jgi:hypothetical protein
MPASTVSNASRRIIAAIWMRPEPSAMRIPISFVFRLTV